MSAFVKYRPDIDGLRAIAVGSVVLYHAGFGIVSGGFVGVDVFFVISGYLITLILAREISGRRFSLLGFYDRRVRRILPAYVFMAAATSLAAYLFLPPVMLDEYGGYLVSTAIFLSNFYFRAQANYFAAASDQNLLLHTWSLSVEEQFYIFWPLMLFVVMLPVFAKWRRILLFGFFLGSLALASYAGIYRPESAFYYSPLRAWELLLGALLALGYFPQQRDGWREAASFIGLAMILVAAIFYGMADVPFPGLSALLPCGGAALIIWAGEGGHTTRTGRFLSLKPFVFIGLISYSLYLWHWPIIAMTKIYIGRPLAWPEGVALVVVSVLMGWFSYRFAERPFRRRTPRTFRSELKTVSTAAGFLVLLAGVGLVDTMTGGLPGRADARTQQAQMEVSQGWRGTDACLTNASSMAPPTRTSCRFGDPDPDHASVVLWGDSHANHFAPTLDELGQEMGFGFVEYGKQSCSPVAASDEPVFKKSAVACNLFRKRVLSRILDNDAFRTVVLAAYWSTGSAVAGQEAALKKVVDALLAGGKEVVLVGSLPRFSDGGGRCIVIMRFNHRDEHVCFAPADEERARLKGVAASFRRVSDGSPHVHLVQPFGNFCDDKWCSPLADDHVAFRDEHHLNLTGAKYIVPAFREVFADLGTAQGIPVSAGN